jgi:uncharacterized protein
MISNEQVDIDLLPNFICVDYEPMAEKAPWEALIGWLITYTILLTVAVVFMTLLTFPTEVILSFFAGLLVLVSWTTYVIFAGHKKRGLAVREHDILYKRGLIWRAVTIIPFNRIQHIESHRGPIERKLGLATLKIYTAGGASSDIAMSGLTAHRASQLRELILNKTSSEVLADE